MKALRKFLCIALALAMVLALGVTAWADGDETTPTGDSTTTTTTTATTYTITVSGDNTTGSYAAYQIFTGDLYVTTDDAGVQTATLSNIQWGSGITDAGKAALCEKYQVETTDTKAARHVAEAIAEAGDANAMAEAIANYLASSTPYTGTAASEGSTVTISGVPAGYYLVKNTSVPTGTDDTGLAYTDFIVKVANDVTVNPKGSVPTVTKKVDDKDDSTPSEDATSWQDSADYDIGDSVPFQLTGTLPGNYADYYSYQYIFHDTLSAGLTYNADFHVYINGDTSKDITDEFTPSYSGTTLTFTCSNLKAEDYDTLTASDTIVVVYSATLNTSAVIGAAGNPNTVYLEYSNNPTYNGTGDDTTGHTPTDKVTVFTYEIIVNKIDDSTDKNPLKGAGFTLYKYDADDTTTTDHYVAVGEEVKGTDLTTFTWAGIDAGIYRLKETTTPAGYNTCDDIDFTVTATHDTTSDDPTLTSLTCSIEDFTVAVSAGTLTSNVVNESGAVLPSTGGIGTTLFYVLGSLMVVAAGVILFVRRKVSE